MHDANKNKTGIAITVKENVAAKAVNNMMYMIYVALDAQWHVGHVPRPEKAYAKGIACQDGVLLHVKQNGDLNCMGTQPRLFNPPAIAELWASMMPIAIMPIISIIMLFKQRVFVSIFLRNNT